MVIGVYTVVHVRRICEFGEFPSQCRFFIFKESVDHIVLYPAVSILKLRFSKVFARPNII